MYILLKHNLVFSGTFTSVIASRVLELSDRYAMININFILYLYQ